MFILSIQWKKTPRKELSKKRIKMIEAEECQPFWLYLRIYKSSQMLFDYEYEVYVDRDFTIEDITRNCFNHEVASKIHVRHWTISLPFYLTISPSVFPQFRSAYGINESVESTRLLRSYNVLALPNSAVILRPKSFGPPPALVEGRSFGPSDDLGVQEKWFKKSLDLHLQRMWVSLQII